MPGSKNDRVSCEYEREGPTARNESHNRESARASAFSTVAEPASIAIVLVGGRGRGRKAKAKGFAYATPKSNGHNQLLKIKSFFFRNKKAKVHV